MLANSCSRLFSPMPASPNTTKTRRPVQACASAANSASRTTSSGGRMRLAGISLRRAGSLVACRRCHQCRGALRMPTVARASQPGGQFVDVGEVQIGPQVFARGVGVARHAFQRRRHIGAQLVAQLHSRAGCQQRQPAVAASETGAGADWWAFFLPLAAGHRRAARCSGAIGPSSAVMASNAASLGDSTICCKPSARTSAGAPSRRNCQPRSAPGVGSGSTSGGVFINAANF